MFSLEYKVHSFKNIFVIPISVGHYKYLSKRPTDYDFGLLNKFFHVEDF